MPFLLQRPFRTTIVEALLAGRQGIGFDIDPLALRLSQVKTVPMKLNQCRIGRGGGKLKPVGSRPLLLALVRHKVKPKPPLGPDRRQCHADGPVSGGRVEGAMDERP
jgi:hypothetical protein